MGVKTIGRNQQKKAELIFANAKNIKSYNLDNCFTGKDCKKLDYKGDNWMLQDWRSLKFAKLTEVEPGKYQLYFHTLYFHTNHWVNFDAVILIKEG